MTTTLADLKQLIADRTDIPLDSGFLDELTAYINQSYDELYSLMIKTFAGFFIETYQFTVAAGQDGYVLPENVRYIYVVDGAINNNPQNDEWYNVNNFMLQQRNSLNGTVLGANTYSQVPYGVAYRWIGRDIKFIPARLAPNTYRVWYVKTLTKLVNDEDEILFECEPYIEYIIRDASSKLLMKEESVEASMYWRDQTELYRRYVEGMASDRDQMGPERTVDTFAGNVGGNGGFGWF